MLPSPHRRQLQARLMHALGDTPAVCLAGASRTGKSTLLQALRADFPSASCHSFTDPATWAEATRDPGRFLASLPGLAFLDDVDQVPALLPCLRAAMAEGRKFLLTTPRILPGLAATFSSSLEACTLWPLAQAEREGVFPGLIDACFQGDPTRLRLEPLSRQALLGRVLAGGFPEVADLSPAQRERWFHGYLGTLVQGRLRNLTELREVRHLIRLLAGPDSVPARRCRDLLEDCHLLVPLGSAAGSRSRWYLDSALQAHLLGLAPAALAAQPMLAAPLLETFAVMELVKTAPWSRSRPKLTRVQAGPRELVVLENHRGQLVAITVSAAATVEPEAFQALQVLRDRVGTRLQAGLVLHAGGAARAVGSGLWSLPFQALWAPIQ